MFTFPKNRSNFRLLEFDIERYKQALADAAAEAVQQAALLWLLEATGIIPVWSGASHGTFLPIADALGIPLPIDPEVTSRIQLGRSKSDGEFEIDVQGGKYFFSYKTELEHLIYNEYNDANSNPDATLFSKLRKPGPYGFQIAAQKAFESEIRTFRPPDPFLFVTSRRA